MNGHLEAYIDPTPVSARTLSRQEMEAQVGGALPFAVVIITCGGTLGSQTVVTTGVIVVTVIDKVAE